MGKPYFSLPKVSPDVSESLVGIRNDVADATLHPYCYSKGEDEGHLHHDDYQLRTGLGGNDTGDRKM
jgi:hypothetical protein